jgi:hypothetical protein
MMRLALASALMLGCLGCLGPSPTMEECEALCARQGKKVTDYRIGTAIIIVKPRPSVICGCG